MRWEESNKASGEAGTTLVEVIIAMLILATGVMTMAQLFVASTATNMNSRKDTLTTIYAEQKLEQLRALTWGFDVNGLPLSDFATDTTVDPPVLVGGTGLQPSPTTALQENTFGYVDHIGSNGQIVGNTALAPAGTVYTRRWSIEPLPTNPNNTLIIQVLVYPNRDRGAADQGKVARLPNEARVITVKTRKAQ
jgi:type II secretory pathway pseudopilin PulG